MPCRQGDGEAGHPGGSSRRPGMHDPSTGGMTGRGGGWEVALSVPAFVIYVYGTWYLKSRVGQRKGKMMVSGRRGRPQVSSRVQVEAAAFELFFDRGYTETSIMDIVAVAGISKTTFFRYFPNKAALMWSSFEEGTRDLQAALDTVHDDVPVMEVIRAAVLDSVAAQLDDEGIWRARFRILDTTRKLQAEGAQRWSAWAEVVARFVASRVGVRPTTVVPAGIGGAVQSVVLGALRDSVEVPAVGSDLLSVLDTSLSSLGQSLQTWIDEQSDQ
jgi:AcrR family transcriptional regulator